MATSRNHLWQHQILPHLSPLYRRVAIQSRVDRGRDERNPALRGLFDEFNHQFQIRFERGGLCGQSLTPRRLLQVPSQSQSKSVRGFGVRSASSLLQSSIWTVWVQCWDYGRNHRHCLHFGLHYSALPDLQVSCFLEHVIMPRENPARPLPSKNPIVESLSFLWFASKALSTNTLSNPSNSCTRSPTFTSQFFYKIILLSFKETSTKLWIYCFDSPQILVRGFRRSRLVWWGGNQYPGLTFSQARFGPACLGWFSFSSWLWGRSLL